MMLFPHIIPAILILSISHSRPAPNSKQWIGKWSFDEFSASDDTFQTAYYTIDIYKSNNKLYANINANGNRSWIQVRSTVLINDNRVLFYYSNELVVPSGRTFPPRTLLIELLNTKEGVQTIWHGIQPISEKNSKPGTYFKKVSH